MTFWKTHTARVLCAMSLLVGLLAFGGTALASGASAQSAPPGCKNYKGSFSLSASNPSPAPGETIHILGTGFKTTATGGSMAVTLTANGKTIGTVTSAFDGTFDFTWTVPTTAKDGTKYKFSAKCGGAPATTTIEVSAVSASTSTTVATSPTNLPSTGSSNTLPLLATGVSLVVVGGLLLLAMRKRTQRAGHAA